MRSRGLAGLGYTKLKRENQQLKEIIGVLSLEVYKSKKRQVSKVIKAKAKHIPKKLIPSILKVFELNPSYGHRRIAIKALGWAKTGSEE